jgi:uracil-DNA glycosylase
VALDSWQAFIEQQQRQPYFQQTIAAVAAARQAGIDVYPPESEVFAAFAATPLNALNVVILGQDPYHGPGQAHGLSFSVPQGVKTPPSLRNIFKELASDIEGYVIPEHGDLSHWARQGVLLLNTVLTVEAGKAHSHAKLGWEKFTDTVIALINAQKRDIIFMLWGTHAQKKGRIIDREKHFVLEAAHPSPLSAHRGFLGCRHFSTANNYLLEQGKRPINW